MPLPRHTAESLARRTKRDGECWIWLGAMNRDGRYGLAYYYNLRIRAHRLSYALAVGPIPEGLQVLHRCDRPLCINPAHLFLGTDAINVADKVAKGRQAVGEGCRHPHRVLSDARVRELRELRAKGWLIRALQQRYGCSKNTILRVLHGEAWRHV